MTVRFCIFGGLWNEQNFFVEKRFQPKDILQLKEVLGL